MAAQGSHMAAEGLHWAAQGLHMAAQGLHMAAQGLQMHHIAVYAVYGSVQNPTFAAGWGEIGWFGGPNLLPLISNCRSSTFYLYT